MRQINVLQVSHELGIGGIAKVLQDYSEHLSKEIFKVTVCGLFQGGPREKLLKDQGFEVFLVNGNKNDLVSLMQRKEIDVLHIHQYADLNKFALRAAREAKVPVIVETNVFGRVAEREGADLPDMNFLVSKMCAVRYKLWNNWSWKEFFNKSAVLYNPVVLSDFAELDDPAKKELRRKYRIPADAFVIGRHGRPDPVKWGDACLKMMPYLLKIVPNVKYLALGLPQSKVQMLKSRGLESSFRFLEPTADFKKINEFLQLLDVFSYSSVNGESFGLAIAEAMACRKPVVVNSTPCRDNAQVELVDHGKTGLVANHPRAFAQALAFLLKNGEKRREMGEAARRKIQNNYEVRQNALRLEKFYVELLSAKGREIAPGIKEKYANLETRPTRQEIVNFEKEYERRTRECLGRKNYLQIYLGRLILRDFKKYNRIKKIKEWYRREVMR